MSIFGSIMGAIFPAHAAAAATPAAPMPEAQAPASAQASTASPTPKTMDLPPLVAAAAPTPMAAAPKAAPAPMVAAPQAKAVSAAVDVAKILDGITAQSAEKGLDWKKSIVDLMKLLKLDSSLKARKELAHELNYSGDMGESATMNVWLHKQVMTKLAENGGVVPKDLMH